jgi:hypothetical protein
MRTVELLQILGPLVGAFASITIGLERRLLRHLKSHEATSVESAISLPKLRAISRWRLSRLLKHNVVRGTAGGLFYFDDVSHRKLRKRRLTIAIPAMLAAATIVVLLHAVFD